MSDTVLAVEEFSLLREASTKLAAGKAAGAYQVYLFCMYVFYRNSERARRSKGHAWPSFAYFHNL